MRSAAHTAYCWATTQALAFSAQTELGWIEAHAEDSEARDPAVRQPRAHERFEERAGDEQRAEQRHHDAQAEHDSETDDEGRSEQAAEEVQHQAGTERDR